jgi:hypothetical protein
LVIPQRKFTFRSIMYSDNKNLWDRIVTGRTDLIVEFIAGGNNAKASDHGVSLIQWAAYYGDTTAIKFLINHGECLESLGVPH